MSAQTSTANGITDTTEPWLLLDETPHYLIISKPTRMLTQPGKEAHKTDSLITRVCQEFPEARIVHRLDWDTSGIMVLARTIAAHRALSIAFQERQTEKRYQALVDACPQPESGLIDLPIGADCAHRPRYRIDYEAGRAAQTRYRVLEHNPKACRLALCPITGRSHQLRVHLLAQGRPIQGDTLYHPNAAEHPRLMLHAEHLAFPDPVTGQWRAYQCPVPF